MAKEREFAWGATLKHEGICVFCGKKFVYYRKSTGGTPKKYCSDECAHEARLKQYRQCNKRRRQEQTQKQEQKQIHKLRGDQLEMDAAEARKQGLSYGQYKAQFWCKSTKIR